MEETVYNSDVSVYSRIFEKDILSVFSEMSLKKVTFIFGHDTYLPLPFLGIFFF